MDIRIIQVVLDIFDHYGEGIRFDYERFEEALNDEAPDLMEECYLVTLGMKMGVFDAMIFDEELEIRGYVDYLEENAHLTQRESLFMTSVLESLIGQLGYYFEIPDMLTLLNDAYQRHDFDQLAIIAKTYFVGFGVAQDYERAFGIYSYLYGNGDDRGAYYLGYMYEHGYGIEQDIEKALQYYESRHDDLTCMRLGKFYMFGQYVEQNLDKAYLYFNESQEPEAYLYKGLLLEQQKEHASAFEAYYEGAQVFQPECLYKAALCLRMGIGVEMNLADAQRYFEYAYFLLHGDSTYQLAMMSFDGIVVEKDEKKALQYLHQAAYLHSYEACLILAQFYELGRYVKRNHQKSLGYYHLAQDILKNSKYDFSKRKEEF